MTDHWNDPEFLADLYTQDAIVLANLRDWRKPWLQGNRQAAEFVGSLYGRPYAITPVVYASDGTRVRLAGYCTRGEGDNARHFAFFYFELIKGQDGRWRIAVDNRTFEPRPQYQETISGEQLLHVLDAAGIQQAVVLSDAYWFDSPVYRVAGEGSGDEYRRVQAENDWTAVEAAKSGGRLVAFCSFNPLADYARKELARCKSSGTFAGLKLHLQMSGVDLHKAADVEKVREVFATADKLGLPITVHAQTVAEYDAAAAQTFVDKILPAAPQVTVILAHLWGGGPFAPKPLQVYVDAVSRRAPGTKNLYFDVAEAALVAGGDKEILAQIANAIHRIGASHILFGSDAVGSSALSPEKAAAQFRHDVPLTPEEFAIIAANRLPFLQQKR
jgi:predicted TIM-barrel fold metal-dependent hydrolase